MFTFSIFVFHFGTFVCGTCGIFTFGFKIFAIGIFGLAFGIFVLAFGIFGFVLGSLF